MRLCDIRSRAEQSQRSTGVLHELRHVRRLAAGRGAHVEHALVGLRRERHHRQHAASALQHVVAGEVLGRRADRHLLAPTRAVHYEADLQRAVVRHIAEE